MVKVESGKTEFSVNPHNALVFKYGNCVNVRENKLCN